MLIVEDDLIMAINTFSAKAQLQEGLQVKVTSRDFEITVDEPEDLGGTDTNMTPGELTLSALGACQAIVARIYADKFKIEFESLSVDVEGDLDIDGFMNKSDVRPGFSDIRFNINIVTNASKNRVTDFIKFVEKISPIGDTIANPVNVQLKEINIIAPDNS